MKTIDMDATYRVKRWPGVAVRVYGDVNAIGDSPFPAPG